MMRIVSRNMSYKFKSVVLFLKILVTLVLSRGNKIIPIKNIYTLSIVFDIFFFFLFLFSLILDSVHLIFSTFPFPYCSLFFSFFFRSLLFLATCPLFFFFLNVLFNFFFLNFFKNIIFYWFLLVNGPFISNTFIVLGGFSLERLQFFLVLVRLKFNVKTVFEVKASSFS